MLSRSSLWWKIQLSFVLPTYFLLGEQCGQNICCPKLQELFAGARYQWSNIGGFPPWRWHKKRRWKLRKWIVSGKFSLVVHFASQIFLGWQVRLFWSHLWLFVLFKRSVRFCPDSAPEIHILNAHVILYFLWRKIVLLKADPKPYLCGIFGELEKLYLQMVIWDHFISRKKKRI